jgi:hypothetical protein
MTQSEQFDTELFILEIKELPALWYSTLWRHKCKWNVTLIVRAGDLPACRGWSVWRSLGRENIQSRFGRSRFRKWICELEQTKLRSNLFPTRIHPPPVSKLSLYLSNTPISTYKQDKEKWTIGCYNLESNFLRPLYEAENMLQNTKSREPVTE